MGRPYGYRHDALRHEGGNTRGRFFCEEEELLGCAMGSNRFEVDIMPRYVDFYLAGRLKLDDLLEDHIKLEQVNEAFNASKTGEVARKVIVFNHLV